MAAPIRQFTLKAIGVSLVLLCAVSILSYSHDNLWACSSASELNQIFSTEQGSLEQNDSNRLVSRTIIDRIFDGTKGNGEYRQQTKKGRKLSEYLLGTGSAGERCVSQWKSYQQLEQWGWVPSKNPAERQYVQEALRQSSEGWGAVNLGDLRDGIDISWKHSTTTEHASESTGELVQYPATNGYYQNTFFTNTGTGGIIFAMQNNNPRSQVEEAKKSGVAWRDTQGHPLPIVPLEKWSDIVALTWLELTEHDQAQRKGLRWIHRGVITNERTKATLSKIARQRRPMKHCVKANLLPRLCEWRVPKWPGLEVKPGTDDFYVLLGAPNGYGIAWLLIQHKATLGHLTIESIRAWDPNPGASYYNPALLFELDPA